MKRLKNAASMFTGITTGVVIAATVFISLYGKFGEVSANILWQALVCAFLCALGSLIYPQREVSKREMCVLTGINYILVNLIVLGCGFWFDWFSAEQIGRVVTMIILITAVFASVWISSFYRQKKLADELNKRLEAYQKQR